MVNSTPHPVILVHGIKDDHHKMDTIAQYLQNRGRPTYGVDLRPRDGSAPIAQLALQLQEFIDRHLGPDTPCDLVGFSMGGLVSRYYLQRLGGLGRVRHYVSVSAPHQGTWAAYFSSHAGIVDMRPHSPLLQDLQTDIDRLGQITITSIWTPLDLIILPADSSRLPLGTNLAINVIAHPLMVRDKDCLKAIGAGLGLAADHANNI
jgi:triacylglycerol lipase